MPASSSQPARRLDLNLARQFSGWSRSTSATCQANWAPVAARPSQNGQSRPAAQPAEPNRARATAKKPVSQGLLPSPSLSARDFKIGRAHVCPVTNAHLVCRLLLEKKKLQYT